MRVLKLFHNIILRNYSFNFRIIILPYKCYGCSIIIIIIIIIGCRTIIIIIIIIIIIVVYICAEVQVKNKNNPIEDDVQ